MTSLRTLFAQSAIVAIVAVSGFDAANAAVATYSTTVGTPSATTGNNGNSAPSTPTVSRGRSDTSVNNLPRRPNLCRSGKGCKITTNYTDAEICFYTGANFTGGHFCTKAGTGAHQLTKAWNNKISSIEIVGSATVKVCSEGSMNGNCIAIGSSRSSLVSLNKDISSFQSYR